MLPIAHQLKYLDMWVVRKPLLVLVAIFFILSDTMFRWRCLFQIFMILGTVFWNFWDSLIVSDCGARLAGIFVNKLRSYYVMVAVIYGSTTNSVFCSEDWDFSSFFDSVSIVFLFVVLSNIFNFVFVQFITRNSLSWQWHLQMLSYIISWY